MVVLIRDIHIKKLQIYSKIKYYLDEFNKKNCENYLDWIEFHF